MISHIPSLTHRSYITSTGGGNTRMSAVRILADVASRVSQRCKLSSPVPPSELEALSTAVSAVTADDLAVSSSFYRTLAPSQSIFYIPVAERSDMVMAVFVMSPGSSIPLHDHSHMYVASSVLWGRLQVSSYDWVNNGRTSLWTRAQPAKKYPDFELGEGMVRTLTPTQGNIHKFLAKEWTAVFDVVVPPYDDEQGRSCRYYQQLGGNSQILNIFGSETEDDIQSDPDQLVYLRVSSSHKMKFTSSQSSILYQHHNH